MRIGAGIEEGAIAEEGDGAEVGGAAVAGVAGRAEGETIGAGDDTPLRLITPAAAAAGGGEEKKMGPEGRDGMRDGVDNPGGGVEDDCWCWCWCCSCSCCCCCCCKRSSCSRAASEMLYAALLQRSARSVHTVSRCNVTILDARLESVTHVNISTLATGRQARKAGRWERSQV